MRGRRGEYDGNVDIWIDSGPSRRLRKAYGALQVIEDEMEYVRQHWRPMPCHAPSECVMIGRRLRELNEQHGRLLARIGRLEGDDEDGRPWRLRRRDVWKGRR